MRWTTFVLVLVLSAACSEESGYDESYAEGYDDGYQQGLADAQRGFGGVGGAAGIGGTGGSGGLDFAEFTDKELLVYGWGFRNGMVIQEYPCSSDADCLTGEFCSEAGYCKSSPSCEEPHPNYNSDKCVLGCLSRYDTGGRFSLCIESCRCVEYTGEVACRNDDDCFLPWRPVCVEGNVCRGIPLRPDEFLPIDPSEFNHP